MNNTGSYTWYPKDWQESDKVWEMNFELQGLYRLLLDHAYLHGNPFVINKRKMTTFGHVDRHKLDRLCTKLVQIGVLECTQTVPPLYKIPSIEKRKELKDNASKAANVRWAHDAKDKDKDKDKDKEKEKGNANGKADAARLKNPRSLMEILAEVEKNDKDKRQKHN